MTNANSLSEDIQKLVFDLSHKRAELREQFIKTWLAHHPMLGKITEENFSNLISKLRLVEQWDRDRLVCKFWLEIKNED